MVTILKTVLFLAVGYLTLRMFVKLSEFLYKKFTKWVSEDDKEYEFPITEDTVIDEDIISPFYAPQQNKVFIWGNRGKLNHSLYIHECVHSTQGIFMKFYSALIPKIEVHGYGVGLRERLYGIFYLVFLAGFHLPYVFAVELATFLETRRRCIKLGIWDNKMEAVHLCALSTYLIQTFFVWIMAGLVFAYIKSFF
jgi:hypothetical protein